MHLQELSPHTAPLFVSAVRLLPAGLALIAWAAASGRPQPKSGAAWLAISIFGLADATCFQASTQHYFVGLSSSRCPHSSGTV